MRLYLIRHGETDWNAERRVQGHTDVELNAQGRKQAEALAGVLAQESLAAVYTSPLKRAFSTAVVVAAPHRLLVQAQGGLAELDQGELEGLQFEAMEQRYPAFLHRWRAGDTTLRLPGGESMEDLQGRAWAAVQEIFTFSPAETVVAVSHNLAILAILCQALGLPLSSFRRLRQSTGALSLLDMGPQGARLLRFNEVCYQEPSNRE